MEKQRRREDVRAGLQQCVPQQAPPIPSPLAARAFRFSVFLRPPNATFEVRLAHPSSPASPFPLLSLRRIDQDVYLTNVVHSFDKSASVRRETEARERERRTNPQLEAH